MFIHQVQRHFGRNISNIDDRNKTSHQPTKKMVIPRAKATISVYQECEESNRENLPPPGLQQPKKRAREGSDRKPLQQIYPSKSKENDFDMEMLDADDDDFIVEMSDDDLATEVVYDIDEQDEENPLFVTDYVQDIFDFLKEKEQVVKIPHQYMETFQKDLEAKHREILVNWICEVYLQLRLLSETLFLAVDIVDRLLSCRIVTKRKLHLVGLGALMIASKFEETYAPPISDLRICSENAYTVDEMLRVERVILNALDFNLCIPSPLMFLRRYSKAAQSDTTCHTLSKYLCELSVTSYSMIEFLPSHIAVASVYLARLMRNISPAWCPSLLHHSELTAQQVLPCAHALNEVLKDEFLKAKCAIYRKYSDPRLFEVSLIKPVTIRQLN